MANDVIQVNYDALERIQREFSRCAEESARIHQSLKNGTGRLVGSKWEGEAARKFFSEMDEDVLPAFDRLSKALTGCEEVTASLIQEFRQAEEEAAALFRKDGDSGGTPGSGGGDPGTGTGGSTGSGGTTGTGGSGGTGTWGEVNQEDYDWLAWGKKTLGKSVSTFNNALLKILGKTGEIPTVKGVFDGISIGFNFFTDEDFPKDKLRAFAGEAGKYLLKEGIKQAIQRIAPKLVPGVGWVFLGSDAIQLVAYLGAGAIAVAGNPDLAKKITEGAKWIDLGGYLERAAEWGFDQGRNVINTAGPWLTSQANDLISGLQLSPQGALAY
jgi:WXG100 family type VII secretion target